MRRHQENLTFTLEKKVGPVQKGTIILQEIHMQEMKMEHHGFES